MYVLVGEGRGWGWGWDRVNVVAERRHGVWLV